ncbi:hypothetical protein GQ457_08G017480 [Hibiscus cannabinus]
MTCRNPLRYFAIALQDDKNVGIMIAEHESTDIQNIKLYAEVHDVPGSSRNIVGNSFQMSFNNEINKSINSFVTMLENETLSAFNPYVGPSTYATSYGSTNIQFPKSTIDMGNLRGRWGETFNDSSEDEYIEDPNLTCADLGDVPIFAGGEFFPTRDGITWYEPPAHMNFIDYVELFDQTIDGV